MIWFLWRWDDDGIAAIDEISMYLAMTFLSVMRSPRTRRWLSGGANVRQKTARRGGFGGGGMTTTLLPPTRSPCTWLRRLGL
jgi:hypothetical protein